MDFTLIPLSRLDPAGLNSLTTLHCAVMHGLLTDLGQPLVMRYYASARETASVLGVCAIAPHGEVLGWAMGSPDPAALNARLRQPVLWFAGQMTRVAFSRPGVILELMRSLFSASAANKLDNGQVELTYIGTAVQARGEGLGQQILAAFIAQARSAGYKSIALSVETDNSSALALYSKAGFHITHTFTEGRFQRHRMQYPCS